MTKLKVLDSRSSSEKVVVMSWSPKMDLLALGNNKGHVHLHRLSWQKVWQVELALKDKLSIPELMTWHPEGHFLVVTSGEITFVIDVESGKVIHNHETSSCITTARWCTSHFQQTITEVLLTHSRQQQLLKLESHLSILFLGTSDGYVYAYTGGFLLALRIRISQTPHQLSSSRILEMDSALNLESFVFVTEEITEREDEVSIIFSNFKNEYLPRMASIIGPLGLRYTLFVKRWVSIQGEFANLNETWSKIIDLYSFYMTFGGTKEIEVVKVDFMELVLTGIRSVEMEIFLGSAGREKEAKKNINVINSASASITEHIRSIKCAITNMLTELNEIGGFLKQVSGYEESNDIIVEIRKAVSYFFLAILNGQKLIHNFVTIILHFMNLVMNTIHSFNIQELPDFIEEDADTDKVLELLQMKIDKDVLEYLFFNMKIGCTDDEDKSMTEDEMSITINKPTKAPNLKKDFSKILNSNAGENKYKNFSNFIHELLKTSNSSYLGSKGHPLLLDYSDTDVKELVTNIVPRVNALTKTLLSIPVLCSVPFGADSFPLIKIPKEDYFTICESSGESGDDDTTKETLTKRKPFQLFMNETISKVYVSSLISPKKILMFEVDVGDSKKVSLKCLIFYSSRNLQCFEIFSSNHMTIVSYDKDDKRNEHQDIGRTIVCQIPFSSLIARAQTLDVHHLRSKCGKSNLPSSATLDIPLNIYKPSAGMAANSSNIDYILPLEGFCPIALTVSGARKVGALLSENKHSLLILEMELDNAEESTLDETGDDEDDESGSDTSTTED